MLDDIIDPRFTAIELRAFRRLRNLRLDGLARVNVLVGPNNTGKTSVLEAIEACCHPINVEAWLDMVRRRGSRQPVAEQFVTLFPHLASGVVSDYLEIVYERNGKDASRWRISGELSRKPQLIADDVVDIENLAVLQTQLSTHVKLKFEHIGPEFDTEPMMSQCTIRANAPISRVTTPEDVSTATITPITQRSEVFQILLMAAFDMPQFRDEVVALLRRFDDGVQGVEVYDPEGTRSYLRVWHKRTGYMPIAAFGDGFRRVVTYALAVIRCRNGGVLLIDEMETAIHYSALRDVYRWLVKACTDHRVQLFVTTHSLEAIDALLEATPDLVDTSFYRLNDDQGEVRVVRFDEVELRALRQEFGDEVRG